MKSQRDFSEPYLQTSAVLFLPEQDHEKASHFVFSLLIVMSKLDKATNPEIKMELEEFISKGCLWHYNTLPCSDSALGTLGANLVEQDLL